MDYSMTPVPENSVLLIVDVQNGYMNENTDYIPGAINEFIMEYGDWFSEIIKVRLAKKDGEEPHFPDERVNKAGPSRVLKNGFQSRITAPLNKIDCTVIRHSSSTDVEELVEYIANRTVYMCGLETDIIIYPMSSCLQNAGIDVNIIYDLTATAIGTAIQLAMKPALIHLLGESHVIEASIPDTKAIEDDSEVVVDK